jgi:hypothetical protein
VSRHVDGLAGCMQRRQNRRTGTLVAIYDARAQGLDEGGGDTRWYTICEDHGDAVGHSTLALARSHASVPDEWCEDCRELYEQREAQRLADHRARERRRTRAAQRRAEARQRARREGRS